MKFGKELVSQMVPEWQEAYMNYDRLKKLLKDVETHKQRNRPAPAGLLRQISRYRSFSGLIHRHDAEVGLAEEVEMESQAILVHAVNRVGSVAARYETTFLMTSERGGEYEMVFFRRLDDEFNKAERFYKEKVDEVLVEAEGLNRQMDALIAFRIKVENPTGFFDRRAEIDRLDSDVSASAAAISAAAPYSARVSASRRVHRRMDSIDEASSVHDIIALDTAAGDRKETVQGGEKVGVQKMELSIVPVRTPTLEVLNNVTFHNHLETPRSTIKGFLKVPKHTELSFTHDNLRKVEDKLKRAFVEFYHKLSLLRNFSFLNSEAFSKIMKKYDKITSRNAATAYMKMVDNSYLGSSEEVPKLMERVEDAFIKHFANSNRTKGMRVLRPKQKRERHRVTFSVGFFAGCTVALIIALILMVRARHILNQPGTTQYMETLFPLYSLFGFVVLHMVLYAGNIYYWRKYRVNYAFILGFKQGSELGYREVLLMSLPVAVGALACVLANLDMEMDPETKDYKALAELLPLNLLSLVFVIMFCPFNIMYRSSRFFFLRSLLHSLLAPLYKVTLPDFLLADQLTSQVQAFRSLEFYICYYGWGDYKHRRNTCSNNDVFNIFYFIVAVIPYWCRLFQILESCPFLVLDPQGLARFLQCIRRLVEEKDSVQGWNGLKYFLTVVAVCLRTAYSLNKSVEWRAVAWVFSIAAAIFCTYWDLVYDWGLLNRKSTNKWLRDRLLVPHPSIYYGAIVLNVLLRFAWLQSVLEFRVFSLHRQTLITIVASLEIIRRGIWTFFRLENEHLTNIGKYRAFKSVPLPFNYDEEEDDDKED